MIFATQNSIYEVDDDQSRIRRVDGVYVPTPNQGPDGEWQSYETISEIVPGKRVLIEWDACGRRTLTTIVRSVRTRETV